MLPKAKETPLAPSHVKPKPKGMFNACTIKFDTAEFVEALKPYLDVIESFEKRIEALEKRIEVLERW